MGCLGIREPKNEIGWESPSVGLCGSDEGASLDLIQSREAFIEYLALATKEHDAPLRVSRNNFATSA
jgi:hypothetical protein